MLVGEVFLRKVIEMTSSTILLFLTLLVTGGSEVTFVFTTFGSWDECVTHGKMLTRTRHTRTLKLPSGASQEVEGVVQTFQCIDEKSRT
jgi:hypothetical protein